MNPTTGEFKRLKRGFGCRIRIDDAGNRKPYRLTGVGPTDEAAARERCTAMAEMALRLREAGFTSDVDAIMERAARARPGKPWEVVVKLVEAIVSGGTTKETSAKPSVTFGELARDWCSGKLHERFPDDVQKLRTSEQNLQRLRKWVFPVLEHMPLHAITLAHAREVLAKIPATKSRATRKHIAQLMTRVLKFAVYPCEHIERQPLPAGFGGTKGKPKALTHLWPSEDRQLLACAEVPIANRLLYGTLAREGLRTNEALSLTWQDLDLERGSVRLDRNKTDDPRAWALDQGVARALVWWKRQHADDEPTDKIFRDVEQQYWLAIQFRAHLARAKVNRPELTEKSDVRRPIRAHDLRATFVTVSLANGKTEAWIADRTGHRSSAMISKYRRAARTHSELGQGALAPLDEALGLPRERPAPSSNGTPGEHLGAQLPANAALPGNTKSHVDKFESPWGRLC